MKAFVLKAFIHIEYCSVTCLNNEYCLMTIYKYCSVTINDTVQSKYSLHSSKIADKVANGAYFYSHFAIESDNTLLFEKVQKVIEKLTLKYIR